MRVYHLTQLITGIVNTEVLSTGLTSVEGEEKTLIAIMPIISARQNNQIKVWYKREELAVVNDGFSHLAADPHKIWLPVEIVIPIGDTVQVALNSGGTANNCYAIYQYTIAGKE